MALEYKSKIGLEAVTPIIDEYVVWHGKLVASYLEERPMLEPPPLVFSEWMVSAKLPDDIADRARSMHGGMVGAAKAFAEKYTWRFEPPFAEYAEFAHHYEEFIQFMHRLEIDMANENSGFDKNTGLRSVKLMHEDIKREMDRLSRRGNPFSIALVRIDDFKEEWRANPGHCEAMIRDLSARIQESLRSFDDAYYMGGEYYLLALKHADMLGAQAAIRRLTAIMAEKPVHSPDDPAQAISVSTVLHEPEVGDEVDPLLANMKKDLADTKEKAAVLQYNDISPLQRYIHSTEIS
ncbi:MAG: diguanylate cyclase [Micavibrio sp.]